MPGLDKVVALASGTDHILALSQVGTVYAWGNGQQLQLGRRVVERTRLNGLFPRELSLKDVKFIGAGSYHSFAVNRNGKVHAWGLNQYGQCGIESKDAGEDGAVVTSPTVVENLSTYEIRSITGGEHHSIALTTQGKVLVWGRLDGHELGIPLSNLPKDVVKDASGRPRFLVTPTELPNLPKMIKVYSGTHHNIAIDEEGRAWSWGFGESYQVGQGPPGEDIEVPTMIENTATKDVRMVIGGAGGQFSVLAGMEQEAKSNSA